MVIHRNRESVCVGSWEMTASVKEKRIHLQGPSLIVTPGIWPTQVGLFLIVPALVRVIQEPALQAKMEVGIWQECWWNDLELKTWYLSLRRTRRAGCGLTSYTSSPCLLHCRLQAWSFGCLQTFSVPWNFEQFTWRAYKSGQSSFLLFFSFSFFTPTIFPSLSVSLQTIVIRFYK